MADVEDMLQQSFFEEEGRSARDPAASAGTLEELEARSTECRSCSLRDGCRGVVFGEGNPSADLLLVGEAPGAQEDLEGRPFVGPAGQLLDKILESVGIERSEVYITNVVMCRPPFNRLPEPSEVKSCRPFLDAKIRLIDPAIVVCMGSLATQTLVSPQSRITQVHGRCTERGRRLYVPVYHPAALLRDASKKRPTWEDFKLIRDRYRQLRSA